MKTRTLLISLLVLLLAAASTAAWANDRVVSTVTIPADQPSAVIVNNGVPSGTIQLWYTVSGFSYPCGPFANFNLGLSDPAAGSGKAPAYPVELDLVQSGSGTPVQFSPDPATLSVSGVGWSGSTLVSVSIDCANLPAGTPYDGQEIVGNLNEQTNPQGVHLDTISTIQVHIKLAFPTACVKLYSFESNQDTGVLLSNVTVVANKSGSVKTVTDPVSVDGMVVNNCPSSISFDLGIGLDSDWQTHPHNNPGNATFTYTYAGEVDPSTYTLGEFGTGTGLGETLCINNFTLASGGTMLTRVHSEIADGLTVSSLENPFPFSVKLWAAGSGCTNAYTGPGVDPSNPATSNLTYTVQLPSGQ